MVQKWDGLKEAEGEGAKDGSGGNSRTENTARFFQSFFITLENYLGICLVVQLLFLFHFVLGFYMFKTASPWHRLC